MPEIVTCPKCSRKLRVPDELLGKNVKCPDCKEAFTAAAPGADGGDDGDEEAPAPKSGGRESVAAGPRARGESSPVSRRDDEEDDAPRRRRRPAEDEDDDDHPRSGAPDEFDDDRRPSVGGAQARSGWRMVRLGIGLMLWGIYSYLIGIGLAILCLLLALLLALAGGAGAAALFGSAGPGSQPSAGGGAAVGGIIVVAIVMVFVGYGVFVLGALAKLILDTVGHIMFFWTPGRPGTARRGLGIAVAALHLATLVLPFISCGMQCAGNMMVGASGGRGGGMGLGEVIGLSAGCVNLISVGCTLAWFFVFMVFLRSVALAMGNSGVARQPLMFMIIVPVFILLAFLAVIGVVCVGGMAMAGFASSTGSAQSAGAAGVGWMVAVIAVYGLVILITLGLYIWYVVILHQVRGTISRRLGY